MSTPSQPRRPGGGRWLGRALLAIAAPCLFLVAVEVVLRLVGFGHPTGFVLRDQVGGRAVFRDNPAFGLVCFDAAQVRVASHFSRPVEKEKGLVRVCILGGSAAMGDPDPAYGVHRMLQVMLEARHPDTAFDVVNAGMVAINSHVVRLIAKDLSVLRPDVVVVYLGHNEVVGPYGPGTVWGRFHPRLAWTRLSLLLRRSRLGQLLEKHPAAGTFRRWRGMEELSHHQLPWGDPSLERVYSQLEENVAAILATSRRAGAQCGLCTVAASLDQPPFASVHRGGLTPGDWKTWSNQVARAETSEASGRSDEAAAAWRGALEVDPNFAEAHYRLARAEAGGEARLSLQRALDRDALRFRADSRINESLRRLAGRADWLLDAANDITWEPDDFHDHVHLTFSGTYKLALHVLAKLESQLSAEPSAGPVPDQRTVALRLAYTPWDDLRVRHAMYARMLNPPFTGQWGHDERMAAMAAALRARARELAGRGMAVSEEMYEAALRQPSRGADMLRVRYGDFLVGRGRFREAALRYREVLRIMPHHTQAHYGLAKALAGLGLYTEALSHFQQASFPMRHAKADAYLELGTLVAEQGQFEAARGLLTKALEAEPDDAVVHFNLGMTLEHLGESDQAVAAYERALELDPEQPEALNNLGVLYARARRTDEAAAAFRRALELRPGFSEARANLARATKASRDTAAPASRSGQ